MPDDDDRPRDAGSAADPEWALVAAPDDISALAGDIASYHREQRSARRRERLARWFARPGIVPLSLTAAGLALAAIVATLLALLEPDAAGKSLSALPLAHPSSQVGQPHGLMPDVALQAVGGDSVSSLSLRPGVLALIPLHCECAPLLNGLAGAAYAQKLPLIIVAPTVADAEATALSGQLDRGTTKVFYDSAGALARDFGASGLTLVILDRDGTIFHVQKAVATQASSHLNILLQQMLAPKARASG
jgi:hypothetical protein